MERQSADKKKYTRLGLKKIWKTFPRVNLSLFDSAQNAPETYNSGNIKATGASQQIKIKFKTKKTLKYNKNKGLHTLGTSFTEEKFIDVDVYLSIGICPTPSGGFCFQVFVKFFPVASHSIFECCIIFVTSRFPCAEFSIVITAAVSPAIF